MKLFLFVLVAFIMNACEPAQTTEEIDSMTVRTSWAQSGTLTPGTRGQAVKLQCELEPDTYTVQFGIDGDLNPALNYARRSLALIRWTVNGVFVQRQVDVINGTSVSGRAEAVDVTVQDASTGTDVGTATPYEVSILVSEGSRPSVNQPPVFTGLINAVAPGGNVSVPVPANAGAISTQVTVKPVTIGKAAVPGDVSVFQTAGAAGTIKAYDPLTQTGFVPLSAGTTQIDIVLSGTATDTYYVTVTFGIDG